MDPTRLTELRPGETCASCPRPAVTFAPAWGKRWAYAPACEKHRDHDWERENRPAKGDRS
jgi:hypothetical protein